MQNISAKQNQMFVTRHDETGQCEPACSMQLFK